MKIFQKKWKSFYYSICHDLNRKKTIEVNEHVRFFSTYGYGIIANELFWNNDNIRHLIIEYASQFWKIELVEMGLRKLHWMFMEIKITFDEVS